MREPSRQRFSQKRPEPRGGVRGARGAIVASARVASGMREALLSPTFVLFLLYVFYAYLQVGVRVPQLGSIRGQLILAAVLLVICSTMIGKLHLPKVPVYGWASLLLILCVFRTIFTVDPKVSWAAFSGPLFQGVVMALFIACFVSSLARLQLFIAVFLLCFFKMGLEGFLGTLDGSLIWENQGIPRLHGATPIYEHPNSFSGTQLGVLPYLVCIFPLVGRYVRIAIVSQMLFVLNVVLRTGSRTGYVATVGLVLSFILTSTHRVKALILAVTGAILLVPLVPAEYQGRFATIFEEDPNPEASVNLRKEILADAVKVVKEYPFGVGVAAFPTIRKAMFGRVQDTHNLYLEVATNIGVIGLFAFIGFVGATLWTLRATQRKCESIQMTLRSNARDGTAEESQYRDILLDRCNWFSAIARATILFIITRLFLGIFGMDFYEVYWWFAAGISISLAAMATRLEVDVAHFSFGSTGSAVAGTGARSRHPGYVRSREAGVPWRRNGPRL